MANLSASFQNLNVQQRPQTPKAPQKQKLKPSQPQENPQMEALNLGASQADSVIQNLQGQFNLQHHVSFRNATDAEKK